MTPPLSEHDLQLLLDSVSQEDSFAFFETTRVTAEQTSSLLFLDPVGRLTCHGADDPILFFQQAEEYLQKGFYLAGWLSYEFGYLLEPALAAQITFPTDMPVAEFGVYRTPHIFNHAGRSFTGAGPWSERKTQQTETHYHIDNLHLNQHEEEYVQSFQQIKRYIEAGDTYQVNYTLKILFDFAGSPEALYRTLRRNQNVSYAAYLKNGGQRVISFSPELFFKKRGATCTVRPMKGTMQRGRTLEEDEKFIEFLKHDLKNRSENIMIVDLLRNDLGRLCEMGSVATVSLFDVETYETLHQMTSTIRGTLRPDVSLHSLFRALFPCGSVTGAPKIRTMQIIQELEHEPRGIYTGGIGFITPGGDAVFNVPIRTVVLNDGQGEMGIGSGVVYDSDSTKEWEECFLKGRFLTEPAPDFRIIETILWQPDEGFWQLDLHLARLCRSAKYFGYPLNAGSVSELLATAAQKFPPASHQRVRLTLAKEGAVEITATACAPSSPQGLPNFTENVNDPPAVVFSETPADSQSPYLYHKTTIRSLYDREREKALAAGFYEVLFCNEKGEVTEGSITNIFIRNGKTLYTPPLACGLLDGVFRKYIMNNCPLEVREKILLKSDLEKAEAIYVGNSVRGLVEVALSS